MCTDTWRDIYRDRFALLIRMMFLLNKQDDLAKKECPQLGTRISAVWYTENVRSMVHEYRVRTRATSDHTASDYSAAARQRRLKSKASKFF